MRVGIACYVDPFGWTGGGQLYLRELISAAERLGHEVLINALWPKPRFDGADVDGWIVADLGDLPRRQHRLDQRLLAMIPRTSERRFRSIVERACSERFVHLDNAYVDTCDLGYLPCDGRQAFIECPFRTGTLCHRLRTARLYARARACFFLSPLHAEVVCRLQPAAANKAHIIRPTLDPAPFIRARRSIQDRDIANLFVGVVTEAKGAEFLSRMANLTVLAPTHPRFDLPNARIVVGTPYEGMPDYYGRSRRFIFRPRWPEPFGRVVAEAALAGCELDLEGDVGACSFDLPLSDPALYHHAADEFWEQTISALA